MQEDWMPKKGMLFDNINDAWKFWIDYGGRIGFGVRKQYTHHSKDGSGLANSCRFVCCKEGLRKPDKGDFKTIKPRPETRTGCQARICLKNMGENWMLFDYGYFGDVVSLDSTYCTNSSHRPLAVFSGFNHHRKAVIFGAALLYDETAESYKWLFETFLEEHKQKTPRTVFTDQDQAMAKALSR
ncbi:hypothetical protein TSUD_136070 [Trifolium subterraneum]|uniref:Uncharacterized protein n=1 Tax=Trifolium subterraneum TaxID=3900 RepID=A0A2Z6PMR1_TRISU|nr:hypothetical protein TSUD_136070 [Trifolium subterraneum]